MLTRSSCLSFRRQPAGRCASSLCASSIIIIYCALPGGAGVSCRSAVQRECDTRRPSRVGRLGTGSGHLCRQRRTAAGQCSTTSMRRSTTTDLSAARLPAGTARDERGFGPSMGWVGSGRVGSHFFIFWQLSWVGLRSRHCNGLGLMAAYDED